MNPESYESGNYPAEVYRDYACTVPAMEHDEIGWMRAKGRPVAVENVDGRGLWIILALADRVPSSQAAALELVA